MNTITYEAPRLSRAKAMIGALLATLAIAGTVEAANPTPAAAQKSLCWRYVDLGHQAEGEGLQFLADFYYDAFWVCLKEENKVIET